MNRRDLLKMFGVGATIAPVVGGALVEEAKALVVAPPLVELAKPEIVDATSLEEFLLAAEFADVQIFARRKNGDVLSMKCKAFVSDWKHQVIDVTSHEDGPWRRKIQTLLDINFCVTGSPMVTKSRA